MDHLHEPLTREDLGFDSESELEYDTWDVPQHNEFRRPYDSDEDVIKRSVPPLSGDTGWTSGPCRGWCFTTPELIAYSLGYVIVGIMVGTLMHNASGSN